MIYIVTGGGTMTQGDKTITLKPGMLVHVSAGVAHGVKSERGDLTFVDFAQPPFDPNKIEWIKSRLAAQAVSAADSTIGASLNRLDTRSAVTH